MYVLLTLGTCAVGMVTIIVDAGHRCLSRWLQVSFRRMKPMIVASFQLEGYVWLAIDPTGSSLIGAQWQCWLGRQESLIQPRRLLWGKVTWCRHRHECGVRYNTPGLLLLWAIEPWTTLLWYNISLTPCTHAVLYPFLRATLKVGKGKLLYHCIVIAYFCS